MAIAGENARARDKLAQAHETPLDSKHPGDRFAEHDAAASLGGMPSSSFGDQVTPLLRAGLTLIPIDGKRPRDSRWQLKQYDSAAVVAAADGRHNVGVRIPRNLLVVDVDPRNGGSESFARLAADCAIDYSVFPTVRTGSDGLHIYMWLPEGFDSVQHHASYPGIDFKTSGQVVAPGSVHPSTGRRYVGERMELLALEIPAPQALLAALRRPVRPLAADGGGADCAGILTPKMLADNLAQLDPEEFREESSWRELMMASHHATDGEGRDEFIEWSTQAAGYGDHAEFIAKRWDSLRAREGAITVNTLFRRVLDARGTPIDRHEPEDDFDAIEFDAGRSSREERWPILTLDELDALPPPRWLIEGFLQEATIYGAPESGKSFLAIDMVMSVASGRAWHGRSVPQGAVLYIAAEGAAGLSKRVRAWKTEHGVITAPFHLMRSAINLANPRDAAEFCLQLSSRLGRVSMIVIDTLNQTAAGADENSAQEMSRYIDSMKRMRDATGATVVVVHHSGKDPNKGMRGSTALLGAMDTTIEVVRPVEDGPAMQVRVRKQKDAEKEKPVNFEMARLADSLVLRMTMGSVAQSDSQFIASSLLDWTAAWAIDRSSAPFKDLLEARLALTRGGNRTTRTQLMAALGEGFANAKVSSDGTHVWREREAGKAKGAVTVHAISKVRD